MWQIWCQALGQVIKDVYAISLSSWSQKPDYQVDLMGLKLKQVLLAEI